MLAEIAEIAESPAGRGAPLQGAGHPTAPKPRVQQAVPPVIER